ncbi:MAG: TauD/TfdA dioxygenase family protein [Gammaproteobacteria bacterium]
MSNQAFAAEPLTEHLGVRLSGLEFEKVADEPFFIDFVKKQLAERLLVFIPGQTIDPGTAVRFASRFGPLVDIKRAGNVAHHVPGHEWIKVISNGVASDGIAYGDGNASAQIWHSDSTPWEAPVGTIAFYCRQTPTPPPRTYFKNMIAVYAALPAATRDRIDRVRVIHHFYPRQIEVKIAAEGPSMPLEDRKIGFAHPLVRRHLPSGRPMLYLPTRRDSVVVGMDEAEGRALLEELWDFTNRVDFEFGVGLTPDDFVIWDNSATVHRRDGWDERDTRIMWHISLEGEVPTPMYPSRTVNTIGLSADEARDLHRKAAAVSDY